jgi:hypothetical protein
MLPNRTLRGKTEYLCWIDSRSLLWNVLVKLVNLEKCHSCTYAGTMSAVKPREGGDTPRSWNKTWLSALLLGTPPQNMMHPRQWKKKKQIICWKGWPDCLVDAWKKMMEEFASQLANCNWLSCQWFGQTLTWLTSPIASKVNQGLPFFIMRCWQCWSHTIAKVPQSLHLFEGR